MKKRYWLAGASVMAGAALAARMLARPRDVRWEEQREHLRHAARSRFVEVGGARLHYHEAGDPAAPPVVLLHGFVASSYVWRDVLVPLADAGLRAVAPDLLGSGFSAKPRGGEYTIETQARVVVGLLDALGIGRATLVGSSYGGAVAAVCALDYAERVGRLALVGAVSNDRILRHPLLRALRVPLVGELLSPVMLDVRQLAKRRRWRAVARARGGVRRARVHFRAPSLVRRGDAPRGRAHGPPLVCGAGRERRAPHPPSHAHRLGRTRSLPAACRRRAAARVDPALAPLRLPRRRPHAAGGTPGRVRRTRRGLLPRQRLVNRQSSIVNRQS